MTKSPHPFARVAALAVATSIGLVPALAVPAEAEPAKTVDRVAGYLVDQLVDGDHMEVTSGGDTFPDYGQTADVAFGLLLANERPDTVTDVMDYLTAPENVDAYAHGVPFDTDGATYVGATAKLAFLVELTGGDPRDVGGSDLITELSGLAGPDGRYADVSEFGDNANVYGQAFTVLALTGAGETDQANTAASALVEMACADGTFPVDIPDAAGCDTGTPDTTGLAIQALAAVPGGSGLTAAPDRAEALRAAVDALTGLTGDDGGFTGVGGPNVNSTAYAVLGLAAIGQPNDGSTDWLATQVNDDGGLPINPGQDSDPLASAQGLAALSGQSFLTANPTVIEARAAQAGAESPPTDEAADDEDSNTALVTWIVVGAVVVLAGATTGVYLTRRSRG